jgi:hypothetical protein
MTRPRCLVNNGFEMDFKANGTGRNLCNRCDECLSSLLRLVFFLVEKNLARVPGECYY